MHSSFIASCILQFSKIKYLKLLSCNIFNGKISLFISSTILIVMPCKVAMAATIGLKGCVYHSTGHSAYTTLNSKQNMLGDAKAFLYNLFIFIMSNSSGLLQAQMSRVLAVSWKQPPAESLVKQGCELELWMEISHNRGRESNEWRKQWTSTWAQYQSGMKNCPFTLSTFS